MVPATCSLADTLPHAPPARRTAGFAESIQLAGGFARLGFSPRWWRRPARSQAATSACGGVRHSNQPNEPRTTVPKADQRVTLGGTSPVPCHKATRQPRRCPPKAGLARVRSRACAHATKAAEAAEAAVSQAAAILQIVLFPMFREEVLLMPNPRDDNYWDGSDDDGGPGFSSEAARGDFYYDMWENDPDMVND